MRAQTIAAADVEALCKKQSSVSHRDQGQGVREKVAVLKMAMPGVVDVPPCEQFTCCAAVNPALFASDSGAFPRSQVFRHSLLTSAMIGVWLRGPILGGTLGIMPL